ncbi:MAG: hypothetical protein EPO09_02340 [Aquabacterium sp.]|uniref:hypothetical protein n=1 Tax=Aquabacterium sp. TaxID=1872578 RepID=UPI0012015DB5|nr:hypothetical protein [Aquabacterium sp.]TAK98509.1 MAG: hypothetical protein EPO09_02340 [Aquabacterium sp.]
MFQTAPTDSHKFSRTCSLAAGAWAVVAAVGGLLAGGTAQAQMIPYAGHALHQSTGNGNFTSVRINLNTDSDDTPSHGLMLRGKDFWPHWEGRIGVVVDRPINPLKDSFVLAQPNVGNGLKIRSMHILSDYYLEGGFRATAGLLRGDTGQSWWTSDGTGGGLNLSLQRLDSLGLMSGNTAQDQQTTPYLGAGYSNSLTLNGMRSAWRFNADLGFVNINANNHLGQVFQGDRTLDDLVREMRLRPVVKVSVGYSF